MPQNRDFGSAMEQFTGPLVRFATGGQPVASDIEQLIQSIPNLVVNIPGLGDVDISKVGLNSLASPFPELQSCASSNSLL